ncbi:immunoglobulin-like domain-containing protein [Sporosarcina sp. SAFN-015]|uniref:immunoglobulin-like domain-containing protein n=1 Tax=Sporosarcina sp. SAFN-015 TaxID=3387274 RepID=UPI003F7D0FB0
MKKTIHILMILFLTLFTIQPSPIIMAAESFPGSISLDSTNGTIAVTVNEANLDISLHYRDNGEQVGSRKTSDSANQRFEFTDLTPGVYFVKAEKDGEAKTSADYTILPPAPVDIETIKGINSITVKKGIVGATVTLYNPTVKQFPQSVEINNSGQAVFHDLPVAKGYQLKQSVRGAESAFSESLAIYPNKVTVKVLKHSGPFNTDGELEVTGTKAGNTLLLYKGTTLVKEGKVTDLNRYIFTGLSSGKYYIKQVENGLESDYQDEVIEIADQEAPAITLVGSTNHEVTYPNLYVEPGCIVTDNEDQNLTCAATTIPAEVGADGKHYNPPGVYIITYTATDSKGNTSTAERIVTVLPNVIEMQAVHTTPENSPVPNQRSTGDIIVKNAIPKATLYLYQEPDTLIKTITDSNEAIYTISGVPVGRNYYVIQELNNVKSKPSLRYEVKDTTPPRLKVNGEKTIKLVVGDTYKEEGATATDNVDTSGDLPILIGGDVIDTSKPGLYVVSYNTRDQAGNFAWTENDPDVVKELYKRTVIVSPKSVTAIGSTADMGEVGVKNIFPGTANNRTKVTLYELSTAGVTENTKEIESAFVTPLETTFTFKNVKPGTYYVTQTVNTFESGPSNIVEVIDTDRPHITLEGPDKLSFVWNEEQLPYYQYEKTLDLYLFKDPGATASDYLEGDLTGKIERTIDPDICTDPDCINAFPSPGTYTITYSVKAQNRNSAADDKIRTVTVSPPKPLQPMSKVGTNTITIGSDTEVGIFKHPSTVVNLYNAYDQLMASKKAADETAVEFTDVRAGLAYYVTQTVNGIESAPSNPVNVSLYGDAAEIALLKNFGFPSLNTFGVINQSTGEVLVTVPTGTDVTDLQASFEIEKDENSNAIFTVDDKEQISGVSAQDFTDPIRYSLSITGSEKAKTYTVKVVVARNGSSFWKGTQIKNIHLTGESQQIILTSAEKSIAVEKGISYMADDEIIHISSINMKESPTTNLTIRKVDPSSLSKFNDPEWSKKMPYAIEIGWGGEKERFMQPIEIELPAVELMSFAKISRINGKLYAFIQPTRYGEDNMIGMISEPGTYALVKSLNSPYFSEVYQNGTVAYSIQPDMSTGTVYYTTSSRNVRFDQSSNVDSSSGGYVLDGALSGLSEWSEYENVPVTTDSKELYTFVVQDQMVSLVRGIEQEPATLWKKEIQKVERHKIWEITFNAKVDPKTLHSNSIRLTDDATGKQVKISLSRSEDGKSVFVVPDKLYQSGKQYTLWVDKELKGDTKKREFLKQPTKLIFSVR